jgi:hypothetical protein
MREVTPGGECSTQQVGEPGEKRTQVRTISPEEQGAIEQAPFFPNFYAWLYRLAQAARAREEARLREKPLDQVS